MRLASIALVLSLPMSAQPNNPDLHELFGRYFEEYLRENPEEATSLGRTEHNGRWRDWSPDALDRWRGRMQHYLNELRGYSLSELNRQDRISWQLLKDRLETEAEGLDYQAGLIRVNQLFGLHTTVLLTVREMPFRTPSDYEHLIERLHAVPGYVRQNIALLREAIREGRTQPARVVDLIVRQLDAQAQPGPDQTPLLASFTSTPASVGESRADDLGTRARQAYEQSFRPAWRSLRQFLADEYAPNARDEPAVTSLENGAEIYRHFIRYHTSLPHTAEEIHEIGRSEVARIDRAMESVAEAAGFEGTSAEYERHLMTDPRYLFSDKRSMLAYHRDLAMRVAPELPRFFRRLPRHPVGIRAIPPDREAVSASNYNAPAADGSRPGWFNLKAYMPERQSRFDKPALVLHETSPGHHLQIALQLEMDSLPEFRKVYHSTAYIEGWALYAESLGGALGVYDDHASRFGALESERFRARRLVTDTGLHAMGWSRQQAIEFLGDESEVDRYIAWPGQALAYKMGQLEILALKTAACEAYGEGFDVRDFHAAVLGNGPLPLDMLREQVGEYISRGEAGGRGRCTEDATAGVR
ncbi:MAG: DUF885 domain-containing protein [Bryobacterales bacterium]|nr:DUF885 domain-containing protein [Bryobacterales bacterium]